jgi:flagellar biogenesis protein FliO
MELVRQSLSVVLVLGLLFAVLWALRRKGAIRFAPGARRGTKQRSIVLMERLPLTAQHAVHLVRVADRALLISTGPSSCQLIESLPWKEIHAGHGQVVSES